MFKNIVVSLVLGASFSTSGQAIELNSAVIGGRVGITGGAPTMGATGEVAINQNLATGIGFDQMSISEETGYGELSLSQSSMSAFGRYLFNPDAVTWVGYVVGGLSYHSWSMSFSGGESAIMDSVVQDVLPAGENGVGVDWGGGTHMKINELMRANFGIIMRPGSLADAGLIHAGIDYRL